MGQISINKSPGMSALVGRRGGRKKVFTAEVITAIPVWVEDGMSIIEIAEALDVTPGSLRARCSQLGISLRSAGGNQKVLVRRLGNARWTEVQKQSLRRRISPMQLVARVMAAAVDGALFNAILDDDMGDQ